MSIDAKGFYCHFDLEIFNTKWMNADMLSEFPFLQFNGNPVITINEVSKMHVLNILSRLE